MQPFKNNLIVIVGPTAVGKTDLCIRIAKKLGCDIISCDSRQFYKQMSIGTAKPTQEEMAGVTHHFIDFLEPEEYYSAGRFEEDALKKLNELFITQKSVIMTGGSGLYVQAVCEGMDYFPAPDLDMRAQLYKELEEHGLEPLVEELRVKDPLYFDKVDKDNQQRIIRALEICRSTGQPFSSYLIQASQERQFNVLKIGLERPREEIYDRINARVDTMLEQGLLQEVKRLQHLKELNALQTVGYRELFDYLEGKHDLEEAIRLIKRNTRRYAKRQMTWFKRDEEICWFNPDSISEIEKYILEKL